MGFGRILLNTGSLPFPPRTCPNVAAVSRVLHEHVVLKPCPSAASPQTDRLSLALQNRRSRTWLASHPCPTPNPWLRDQPIKRLPKSHPNSPLTPTLITKPMAVPSDSSQYGHLKQSRVIFRGQVTVHR